MTLTEKLHPDRFTAMSGKMAAIVGYVLGESWSEPEIRSLSVTADGFVTTESEFLGEAADLDRNILNLLVAADLSAEERAEFEGRVKALVRPVADDDAYPAVNAAMFRDRAGRVLREAARQPRLITWYGYPVAAVVGAPEGWEEDEEERE
jgi:hypothetical protein